MFVATLAIFTACKKDEDKTFAFPQVNSPALQEVIAGASVDLEFAFSSEAGFKSASVSAVNGTATIKTDGTADSKSGTIVVTFTASNNAGAGAVELTVTDKESQATKATAVISVVLEQVIFYVSGNITEDVTWKTGKVYVLQSRVTVVSGATLTIEPGVVVKGEAGTGENATALLIARGGKLNADGTAEKPIIFTSIADEIMPGQISSPNLDPTADGLWGGVIVLGNARISASAQSIQIEGIPPSDPNGLYGGTDDADNSGVIRYISIRHGGSNIGEGNEINGLTLGGVGTGTVIENVEVVANQDDGIEWFGGSVSVTNALVWNSGDDALDTDQAWSGTMDNFVIICGATTDHALEIDGPEGELERGHVVKNGSVKGYETAELGDFRDGANGAFQNIYFFGFPDPATSNGRGDFSLSGDETNANFQNGILTFSNLQVTNPAGVAVTSVFKGGTDAHVTEVALGQNTVGANLAAFANWTWASQAGELADF